MVKQLDAGIVEDDFISKVHTLYYENIPLGRTYPEDVSSSKLCLSKLQIRLWT